MKSSLNISDATIGLSAVAVFLLLGVNWSQSPASGRWRCSCGSVWTFNVNGTSVSGHESGNVGNGSFSGSLSGNTIQFRYRRTKDGLVGNGVFVFNGNHADGTIHWGNGKVATPRLTHIAGETRIIRRNHSSQQAGTRIRTTHR